MRKQMEIFVEKYQKGEVQFPRAIDLLNKIRQNRYELNKHTMKLEYGSTTSIKGSFDVGGIFKD